ncbi:MAG: phosphoglucosamine mutase [Proteobacteria bacterium]|nr:phosphoglucosamine mutase [Pseudomonadota bacterium]
MEQERKLFGTDGIRGLANLHPMTPEVMVNLGRALALVFRLSPRPGRQSRVLIGKDTRRSGYMLEDALAAGLCSMGVDVLQIGPIPTPGLAFLTVDMRCDAGTMISASHNSFEDNGVKFFSADGFKLPDELESRIEKLMESGELERQRPLGADLGRARRIDDALGRYIVFLKKTLPSSLTLDGMRVVVDCAHGAAYKCAPTVLEELGATVVPVGVTPDGTNINRDCGALFPEVVAREVREQGADVGIALDGDADRAILVDERAEIVNGDQLLAMCARDLKLRDRLSRDAVVGTVMSNLGLERSLASLGVSLVRSAVGDRYVVEAMLREKINLGGEQSGHMVFLDHGTTGDGILSALQILALMRSEERPLSELSRVMEIVPQAQRSVRVSRKVPFEELPELKRRLEAVETELDGSGRVLVRYSGTEPLARVMLEGEDEALIDRLADEVSAEIERAIGEAGG